MREMVHGTYHDGEYVSVGYEPRRGASQAVSHRKLTRSAGSRTARRGPERRGEGPLPPPEEEVSATGTAYPHALACINSSVLRKDLVRTVVLTVVRTVECTMERTVVPTVVPVRGCFHGALISPTDRPELPRGEAETEQPGAVIPPTAHMSCLPARPVGCHRQKGSAGRPERTREGCAVGWGMLSALTQATGA